ncbi:hypothetical protein D3C85_1844820 [compost metagenome]
MGEMQGFIGDVESARHEIRQTLSQEEPSDRAVRQPIEIPRYQQPDAIPRLQIRQAHPLQHQQIFDALGF